MNNELYHYGILGQKWGVRRFQNPDGSLTEAGRERYSKMALRVAKEARYGGGSIRERSLWKKAVPESTKKALRVTAKEIDKANRRLDDLNGEYFREAQQNYRRFLKEDFSKGYPKGWPSQVYSEEFEYYMFTHPKFREQYEAAEDEYNRATESHREAALEFARDLLGRYSGKEVKVNAAFGGYAFSYDLKPYAKAEVPLADRLIVNATKDLYSRKKK